MASSPTILVVDDDPSIRMGLKLKIGRQGYNVITAEDGNEGLQMVIENLPDLVLSDIMMPFPDGFEMRRILRQDRQLASIPFIFLTARTDVQDRIRGLREGADDYIMKPFDTEELLARIEAVIRRVEAERAVGREQMKAQAGQDMVRLKHEILKNFQHELKTPLTNLLMPLEMAANSKFASPEEQAHFIRKALSSANRLESLTTDLILLSNIDQGTLNTFRQPVDVRVHLLERIRKRLERVDSGAVKFSPHVSLTGELHAPRLEFAHAVQHLVDNAVKFSPEGGEVRLSIQPIEGGTRITVQDQGPGIPPGLRETVFERFFQASAGDTRKHDGLGVGLTIARAVFESCGGYVQVLDSAYGCRVQAFLPE